MNSTAAIELAHSAGLWLCTYLLHSSLLLGAAWLVTRAVRSARQRERIWRAALVGGLLTASLQPWLGAAALGAMRVAVPASVPAVANGDTPETLGSRAPVIASTVAPPVAPDPAPREIATASTIMPSWPVLLTGLWLAGAIVGVAHLVRVRRRLLRTVVRRPLEDELPRRELAQLAAGTGRERDVLLSESSHVRSPVALGAREICLPRDAWRNLSSEERRSLLAHELAHLVRRDPAWLLAAHALERLFFLQPLHRTARRNLAREAEYLSDDWAVQRAGGARELAHCLVQVASWHDEPPVPSLVPAMAPAPSHLVQRVERLLHARELPPSRAANLALGTGVLGAVTLVACAAPGVEAPAPSEDALAESSEPSGLISAEIEAEPSYVGLVDIGADGSARILRGERELGRADLSSSSWRADTSAVMAALAQAMPRKKYDEMGGIELPVGRVRIRIPEGARYTYVQRLMECCGTFQVQIWDLEVVGADSDGRVYEVPLPSGIGVDAVGYDGLPMPVEVPVEELEEEEDGVRAARFVEPERVGLRIDANVDGSERAISYRLSSNRWALASGTVAEVAVDDEVPAPFRTSDRAELTRLLTELHAKQARQQVTIDAMPGTLYEDVTRVLDVIDMAGFESVLFRGSRE